MSDTDRSPRRRRRLPSRPDLAALRVAGVDEVGRGCLAGPVYAAAVILDRGHGLRGLDDSKALDVARREALAPKIEARAVAWAIGIATREEIDQINILRASLLAMSRAVEQLLPTAEHCLIDGNMLPQLSCPAETLIGGDGLHPAIMAASILAKVARDRAMAEYDALYPGYGFATHKGYATPAHRAALRELGPSPLHRMSFAPCRAADGSGAIVDLFDALDDGEIAFEAGLEPAAGMPA